MEIRHLEIFLEVSKLKSFSKAAESLHISQPTISRTVMELEEELGFQVFRRTNKEIRLTNEGEKLVIKASDIVNAFRGLKDSEGEGVSDNEGRIFIGLPPITSVVSFTNILGGFRQKYPNIKVQLFEQGPKQIEKLLREGLLDFGVFLPEDPTPYEYEWFEQDLHAVVMPAKHPLSSKVRIGYEDLKDEQIIIYNSDYIVHDQLLAGFEEHGIVPKIGLETCQRDLMVMLAESGFGLAIMPRKFAKQVEVEQPGCVSRPFDDSRLKMNLALVRKKSNYFTREAKLFQKYYHEQVQDSGFRFVDEGLE